jgi:hypothetical protein
MIVVCQWQINRAYIAKNLCENRNVPNSCCEGKCQLKKRLSKVDKNSEQQQEKNNSIFKLTSLDAFTLEEPLHMPNRITEEILPNAFRHYINGYHFLYSASEIKPPSHPIKAS